MPQKARRIYTNFSKGELSPLLEGRPDLAPYFEGLQVGVNWYLLRQGGLIRRPGLRFCQELKYPDKDCIILSFRFSVNDSFILEFGHLYIRFFKNDAKIGPAGGAPYEIISPYAEENLRSIHVSQSADVLFIWHPLYQQRRLSRIADDNWVLSPISYHPPPSFEKDTNISEDVLPAPPSDIPGPEIPPPGGTPVPPEVVHPGPDDPTPGNGQ